MYSVELHEDDENFVFYVREKATEQPIKYFAFKDEANQYKELLENGAAFSGHTPAFMLINVPDAENINLKFKRIITSKYSE